MTGKFSNPSEEVRSETKSVEKHNKFSESVFAYTDFLIRTKPSLTRIAAEAYVMYCFNRDSEWLAEKTQKEKDDVIAKCRRNVPEMRRKFRERRQKIQEQRVQNMERKRREEEERRKKRIQMRELIRQDVLYYGLWQTEDEVNEKLSEIPGKGEKVDALKAQLRFREHMLQQEESPTLFRFSTNQGSTRRQLTTTELTENVKELIRKAKVSMAEIPESRYSQLVGKRICHTMEEEGTTRAYEGNVISVVPGYPDWINIKYDEYDEDIYVENFVREREAGNLVLL